MLAASNLLVPIRVCTAVQFRGMGIHAARPCAGEIAGRARNMGEQTMAKLNKTNGNNAADMTAHETKIAAEVNDLAADENFKVEEPKLSPKNKKTLGIPADHVISWVPFDSTREYNEIINNLAKVRNVSVGRLLSSVLKDALKERDEELRAEAATYVPSGSAMGKTVERLSKMSDDEVEAYFVAEKEKMVRLIMRTGKTEEEARARVYGGK